MRSPLPLICAAFVGIISTTSRLGDRLADSFGMVTVFELSNASAPCALVWNNDRSAEPWMTTITVGRCPVLFEKPPNAQPECVVYLSTLYDGAGFFTPAEVHGNMPNCTLETIAATYRRVAHATRALAPSPPRPGVVGVHIRHGDKIELAPLSADKWMAPYQTTASRQLLLEKSLYDYLAVEMLARKHKTHFYVATDDRSHFPSVVARIEALGGDVVNDGNASALFDLLSLASCDVVVQVTRYSMFSVTAALIGRIPLVNLGRSLKHNGLAMWEPFMMIDMPLRDS